jgi:GT2 family glycosyltransferase
MIDKYAVILTCFNRKNITLRCLKQLYIQKVSAKMDIFLCDDGSTDGTFEAVKELYPEVYVFKGTGNLFWNRGMLAAWEKAISTNQYDAYLWLNDDVILHDDAIAEMMECSSLCHNKSIICGAFCTEEGTFSYGGKSKEEIPLIPNGKLQPVYWLNGNCVLVPEFVVETLGLLDHMFQHHMGDFDYGLRAIESGIEIYTSRQYVGECALNPMMSSRSRKNGKTMIQRFKILYSPLGDNPIIKFRYTFRHFGLLKAIYIFIALNYNNLLSDKLFRMKSIFK